MIRTLTLALTAFAVTATAAMADGELNLYSARHYDTDERLYTDFEDATGITINRIEGKADALIERIKAEGANSPADVLLTVDAGRAWRAVEAGILAPVESDILTQRIPANLRDADNRWFAFSQRARIIFFDKEKVAEPPRTYADLADPKYRGMICARSSSNIYMISLMAAQIAHNGVDGATEWGEGLKANLARDPQGGDTDQLRGIVSGECAIAVSNTYYFSRALRRDVSHLSADIDRIGWIFPDQSGAGAHVNVSIGGMVEGAPNAENAVRFLEYLASDSAQEYFSAGNDEYPAVPGMALSPSVAALGLFRADALPLALLGENQRKAQFVWDAVGYE